MDLVLHAFNTTKHVEILVKEKTKESKVPQLHNLYLQTLVDLSLFFSLTPTSSVVRFSDFALSLQPPPSHLFISSASHIISLSSLMSLKFSLSLCMYVPISLSHICLSLSPQYCQKTRKSS